MVERRKWWKEVCILGLALAFTLLLTTTPALAWWNESWKYRRAITIQSENALSDYQVLVQLNSSNFDFSKAKSDGSDIRFVDEDDATKLSYWIEEWDAVSESAKIWVKVPSIPAGNKTIYLYYNNSEAVSESDGDAVFEFFDDFEAYGVGDFPSDKWTQGNAGWKIDQEDTNKIFAKKGSEDSAWARTNNKIELNAFAVECKLKHLDTSYLTEIITHLPDGASGGDEGYMFVFGYNGELRIHKQASLVASKSFSAQANIWYKVRVIFNNGELKLQVLEPDADELTYSDGSPLAQGYAGVRTGGTYTGAVDNYFVRKYASPEPSVSVGAEEEYTPPSSPQNPNLQITCIPPFTLKVSLTIPAESGYILIGTSPDKYCYVFSHKGSGNYTFTASFVRVNTTYYAKACDSEGVNCTNISSFVCEEGAEVEEKDFTTAYNKLMQGGDVLNISKLGEVVPSIYTSILSDMFWAMFFGGIFLAYWIRQEDVLLPSIVGMIVGGVLIVMLPPSAQHIAYILLTLSIAGTLYSIIKAKR